MSFDYRIRTLGRFFDWRAKYRFGFYQFGVHRVFRVGKLCVFLWRVQ